ncbi:MAG: hypothetical protein NTX45_15050 [Proteobacteria bacterium]|nr:hypothetical protein [Pseudomonadota bacterium]
MRSKPAANRNHDVERPHWLRDFPSCPRSTAPGKAGTIGKASTKGRVSRSGADLPIHQGNVTGREMP